MKTESNIRFMLKTTDKIPEGFVDKEWEQAYKKGYQQALKWVLEEGEVKHG